MWLFETLLGASVLGFGWVFWLHWTLGFQCVLMACRPANLSQSSLVTICIDVISQWGFFCFQIELPSFSYKKMAMFVLSLLWKLLFFFFLNMFLHGSTNRRYFKSSSFGAILMEAFQLPCSVLTSKSGGRKLSFLSAQNKVPEWQTSGLEGNSEHPHLNTEISVRIKLIKKNI